MVIDTSALIAILKFEADASTYTEAIEEAEIRLISAPNFVETSIVIASRHGDDGLRELDLLLYKGGIEIMAFSRNMAEIARTAYMKYGKGRHPAGLNYGDCFSYALAKNTHYTLLFKGNDFSKTDIVSAV